MTKTPKTPLYTISPGDRVRLTRDVLDKDPAASLYNQHQPLKASKGDVGIVLAPIVRRARYTVRFEDTVVTVRGSYLERVDDVAEETEGQDDGK